MWCVFEGGNLDGQVLEIDNQDIDTRLDTPMCSPDQPMEMVRSHGRCVYADSGRRRVTANQILSVFEHHADWVPYSRLRTGEPPNHER